MAATTITTRAELVDALGLAAEIEHVVLLQYLFAAFSLRRPGDEGFDPVRETVTRRFEREILEVTHEEMTHLAVVNQLRAVLGAAPSFHRPNLPQPRGQVDQGLPPASVGPVAAGPSPFEHTLARFDDATLARFMRLELPEGEPDPTPVEGLGLDVDVAEPVAFDYLGDLYRQIRAGFELLGDDAFVADDAVAGAELTWGVVRGDDRAIPPVPDLAAAKAALDLVVLHGEGSPADRPGSHYRTFADQRARLAGLTDQGFDPALPCAPNPRVWARHRDSTLDGTVIVDETTRAVADAANRAYRALLLLLEWVFAYDRLRPSPSPDGAGHAQLRAVSGQAMGLLVRPLGEVLARLPIGGGDARTAGIPFEVYEPARLPTQREQRRTAVVDELGAVTRQLAEVAAQGGPPRCASIGESAAILAARLGGFAGLEGG
jgi:hypothetical protein